MLRRCKDESFVEGHHIFFTSLLVVLDLFSLQVVTLLINVLVVIGPK